MTYHLEDPYRYMPKCFPFIDPARPYSSKYNSNRVTEKNREIQGKMIQLKQQYMTQINSQNQSSEINLLRVRNLASSLNKTSREPMSMSDAKCEVYGARSNKQKNLRRNSHNFPDFVRCQGILADLTSK